MIQNNQELAVTRERISYFLDLLARLRMSCRPELTRGESPSAAVCRGLLLTAAVLIGVGGEAVRRTAAAVQRALDSAWRASSLVEGNQQCAADATGAAPALDPGPPGHETTVLKRPPVPHGPPSGTDPI
jgi:hypothetical protein